MPHAASNASLSLEGSHDTRPQSVPTLLGCKCFVLEAVSTQIEQYASTFADERGFCVANTPHLSGSRPVLAEEKAIPAGVGAQLRQYQPTTIEHSNSGPW